MARTEPVVLAELTEAKASLLNSERGKSFHAHQLWVESVIELAQELADIRGVRYEDVAEIEGVFE